MHTAEEGRRVVHGIACDIELLTQSREQALYRLRIVPKLWLLTQKSDTRVFQEMTVPEIIAGPRKNREDAREASVGNPNLRAVQHVVGAVYDSTIPKARRSRSARSIVIFHQRRPLATWSLAVR